MKTQMQELRRFLLKLLFFITLFILISGITGSWVVPTRLLYGFHFFIYGNLGKMVIISTIIFLLLIRKRLSSLPPAYFKKVNLLFILSVFLLIPVFFYAGSLLLTQPSFTSNLPLSLSTHLLLVSMPILLALGIFGTSFITNFFRIFKKEILICIGLSVAFDLAIFRIWTLWPIFSSGVLIAVYSLLKLTFSNTHIFPPRTLMVNNFAVSIAQACSGLDSIFLFSTLYLIVSVLDWKSLNHKKIILMFFPSLIGTYLVNILRVYLLMIIGVIISPDLALRLFHTYAGMVLFIIYFVVFWRLTYAWMKK